jgi:trigger factor
MKNKKILMTAAATLLAVVMTGCSGSNAAYLSGVKASDYATPCDYSSIPVEEEAPSVSDTYLEYVIQYQLSNSATNEEITDRDDVEEGDIANIDYTGKMDGEEFDGGSATGYDLTIGSGSFIDGFEDGIIGHKVGEEFDLNLTFPEDYSSEDLAGKDVVFTVKVNSISQKVTPELTDEWVASQSIDDVSTVEEYRDYVYDSLMSQAQSTYDSDVQSKVADYVVENSTYPQDPPQEMIDRLVESMKTYYTNYATQYGMELDDFLTTFLGADEDDPEAILTENATTSAKELLVMKAIADKEDLNPSRTEFNTQLSSYAAQAGYSSVDEFKKNEDAESVRESMMLQNVLDFLQKKAVVSEPSEDSDDSTTDSTESTDEAAEDASTEASDDAATESSTEETEEASTEASTEATTEAE